MRMFHCCWVTALCLWEGGTGVHTVIPVVMKFLVETACPQWNHKMKLLCVRFSGTSLHLWTTRTCIMPFADEGSLKHSNLNPPVLVWKHTAIFILPNIFSQFHDCVSMQFESCYIIWLCVLAIIQCQNGFESFVCQCLQLFCIRSYNYVHLLYVYMCNMCFHHLSVCTYMYISRSTYVATYVCVHQYM